MADGAGAGAAAVPLADGHYDPDDENYSEHDDADTGSECSEPEGAGGGPAFFPVDDFDPDHVIGAAPAVVAAPVDYGPGNGWMEEAYTPEIRACSKQDRLKYPNGPFPGKSSSGYFFSFFTKAIQEKIVHETNLYASQMHEPELPVFESLTVEEFQLFVADVLLMGVVKLPARIDYWAVGLLKLRWGMAIKSHARFEQILKNLHFSDNEKGPKEKGTAQKMYKVQLLFDHINETSKAHMEIGEHVAVDEQTIRSKHHSGGIQQYNPNKPAKRHLKVWAMAGPDGFLYHVELYGGATKEGKAKKKDKGEDGLGEKVVLKMAAELPGAWHHMVFDNYFTSPDLLRKLLDMQLYGTGTLRKNRADFPKHILVDKHGIPVQLKTGTFKRLPTVLEDKAERGEYLIHSKDRVNVFSIKDTKVVNLATSRYDGSPAQINRRMREVKADGTKGEFKSVPFDTCGALVWYNNYMGFVDLADMLRKIYGVDLKTRKWTKAVFCYWLNTLRVQSYLYGKRDGMSRSHRVYVMDVIQHLRMNIPERKRHCPDILLARHGKSFKAEIELKRKETGGHWPEQTAHPRRCVWCKAHRQERHETVFQCEHCQVALCPSCMKGFHEH